LIFAKKARVLLLKFAWYKAMEMSGYAGNHLGFKVEVICPWVSWFSG